MQGLFSVSANPLCLCCTSAHSKALSHPLALSLRVACCSSWCGARVERGGGNAWSSGQASVFLDLKEMFLRVLTFPQHQWLFVWWEQGNVSYTFPRGSRVCFYSFLKLVNLGLCPKGGVGGGFARKQKITMVYSEIHVWTEFT